MGGIQKVVLAIVLLYSESELDGVSQRILYERAKNLCDTL